MKLHDLKGKRKVRIVINWWTSKRLLKGILKIYIWRSQILYKKFSYKLHESIILFFFFFCWGLNTGDLFNYCCLVKWNKKDLFAAWDKKSLEYITCDSADFGDWVPLQNSSFLAMESNGASWIIVAMENQDLFSFLVYSHIIISDSNKKSNENQKQ